MPTTDTTAADTDTATDTDMAVTMVDTGVMVTDTASRFLIENQKFTAIFPLL